MSKSSFELEDLIINYDPFRPHPRFFPSEKELFQAQSAQVQLEPIPWPNGLTPNAPSPDPDQLPSEDLPLPQLDCLVVTWTAAEARMLAELFTPGIQIENWYKYGHNWSSFAPLITKKTAPANNSKEPLYYHNLGLYYPTKIGKANVLCLKSNLHVHTDGPDLPLLKWWQQVIRETNPKLIITTGTGGAVGANVKLGDSIVADNTIFYLVGEFKDKPYSRDSFQCTTMNSELFDVVTNEMLAANAQRLQPLRTDVPKIFAPNSNIPHPTIITTDKFLYDDTENTYHLQELGNMVEMDDATLGLVIQQNNFPIRWVAIRNASDPQITAGPNARAEAGNIYTRYGYWTTITSVLSTWAVIVEYQSIF